VHLNAMQLCTQMRASRGPQPHTDVLLARQLRVGPAAADRSFWARSGSRSTPTETTFLDAFESFTRLRACRANLLPFDLERIYRRHRLPRPGGRTPTS